MLMKSKPRAARNHRTRNIVAGSLAAGVAAGVIIGNANTFDGHESSSPKSSKTADQKELLADAAKAREAITQRFGECAVKAIVSRGADKKYPDRQNVDITFATSVTPEAKRYEAKYANGTPNADMVTWDTPKLMPREARPGHTGMMAMGREVSPILNRGTPHGKTQRSELDGDITFTMQTSSSLPKGEEVNLYINQSVDTTDIEQEHQYSDFNATYCGTIALKGLDKNGEQVWDIDRNAPDPGDFYRTQLDGRVTYQTPSQ
jgi:hypothetical protein